MSVLANALFLLSRRVGEASLDSEESTDETERSFRSLRIGFERFEKVASAVRPTIDLDDVAARVEVIVDDVRVGNEIALVAGEYFVDGIARVVACELEEHVPAGRDQYPEVARSTALLLQHEHAGGVDTEIGLLERVLAHRRDKRLHALGERAVPTADCRASKLDAVPPVVVLAILRYELRTDSAFAVARAASSSARCRSSSTMASTPSDICSSFAGSFSDFEARMPSSSLRHRAIVSR